MGGKPPSRVRIPPSPLFGPSTRVYTDSVTGTSRLRFPRSPLGWGESGRPARAARRSTQQPVEILERRAEQSRNVHLRDAEPLSDLCLAQLEPEAHHEDRLGSAVERAQEIA